MGRSGFGANRVECVDDLRALVRGQNPDPFERARERLRSADIALDQPAVEVQRVTESLEDFAGPGLEPSAPELHMVLAGLEACVTFSAARTLIGRPIKLINPNASFWS